MESINIAIVIPAYNESKTIANVILELRNKLQDDKIEIIVVNDSSSDNTGLLAEEAGASVLNLKHNHGYSKAIEKGFDYVVSQGFYSYIITMDADGQHDPESVKNVVDEIKTSKPDLIIGSRDSYARLGERLYGLVFYFLFTIKDPLCGLKSYAVSEYEKIGHFERFDSIGTELMTLMVLNNVDYKVMPIKIRDRVDVARFGTGYKVNIRIIKSLLTSIKYILKFKMT